MKRYGNGLHEYFYNLLKTKKEDSNEIYGTVLDCELNSDGEINPISILEDERKGPHPGP